MDSATIDTSILYDEGGISTEKAVRADGSAEGIGADQPPNGGYGWVCVICVALINAHTWGINSVRTIYIPASCVTD